MVVNKNALVFVFLLLGIILFSSLISATDTYTVIAGKVYTSDYSQSLGDAKVTVVCGSTVETNSKSDGTYAINIPSADCSVDSQVKVTASKNGYDSSSITANVMVCDGNSNCQNASVENIALANPNLEKTAPVTQPSSSGGGGGGGSRRNTGSNVIVITNKNLTNQIVPPEISINDSANDTQILSTNAEENNPPEESFWSKLTGAFSGPGAAGSWIIVIIFLAIVIAAYVFVKRRNTTNNSFYQN